MRAWTAVMSVASVVSVIAPAQSVAQHDCSEELKHQTRAEVSMISADAGAYLTIDGLNTFYIKQGSGPALVLIHGGAPGACTTVNWGANIEFLAQAGFTVYAFDEAGYGRTDNPEDYSL